MPRPHLALVAPAHVLEPGFAQIRDELDVPVTFDPDAVAEAEAAARHGAGAEDDGRVDLRDLPFVTLDPPGSRDLDQALHIERHGAGYRVRYAIADVAAVVRPGGALDAGTHVRGETVYCPDVRVPLHPTVLSEGAASLLPTEDRRAVVWTHDLDGDGEVVRSDVVRGVVRSRTQLDYPGVQRELDAGTGGPDGMPTLLAEVGDRRQRLERARGGVSLARPEQEVVPVDGGWTLRFRPSLPVEEHNAQLSLLTGMAAARMMLEVGTGVLRTMAPPADDTVLRLRRQADALGIAWGPDESYGDVLARLDRTRPEVVALLAAATSLFRGAAWVPFDGEPPEQAVHAAVAAPYAHVTAPLRRLVDRYGSEICLAAAAGREVPEWCRAALPTLGDEMGRAAARTSAVDRACRDLVEAAALASRIGSVLEGVAVDEQTVQTTEPAVVARCDDGGLRPGERVRVRVVVANPATRTLRLAVVR